VIVAESAQSRLDQTLLDSESMRVSISGGGCSGFMVGFEMTTDSGNEDVWLSHNVLSDKSSLALLKGARLEFLDDPFSPKFKVVVPNSNECGCGDSFQLTA
jgi:iron-sulfur cluster insertion protein